MYIPTSHLARTLFTQKLSGKATLPVLLAGAYGSGRYHHLLMYLRQRECKRSFAPFSLPENSLAYIEKCGCPSCVKIVKQKSPDLIVLTGREKIDDVREALAKFRDSRPVELAKKYLVLRNLDFFPKESLDSALKLIEEPKADYEILATIADLRAVPGSVLSRFFVVQLPHWERGQLTLLADTFELYGQFKSVFGKANPKTPYELALYYSTVQYAEELLDKATSIDSLLTALKKITTRCSESEAPPASLFFVVRHMIEQYRKIPNEAFQNYFHLLTEQYRPTLMDNLNRPVSSFLINMDNQLFGFFSAVLVLRKTLGV